jgi:hypothetical protein
MNIQLFIAGILSLVAAAIHGGVGDAIVRRIDLSALPSNPFGDADATFLLIRVTWHLMTGTFVAIGAALIVVSLHPDADATKGVALLAGSLFSIYTLVAPALVLMRYGVGGLLDRSKLLRHPGPAIFVATTVLIWWGAP